MGDRACQKEQCVFTFPLFARDRFCMIVPFGSISPYRAFQNSGRVCILFQYSRDIRKTSFRNKATLPTQYWKVTLGFLSAHQSDLNQLNLYFGTLRTFAWEKRWLSEDRELRSKIAGIRDNRGYELNITDLHQTFFEGFEAFFSRCCLIYFVRKNSEHFELF